MFVATCLRVCAGRRGPIAYLAVSLLLTLSICTDARAQNSDESAGPDSYLFENHGSIAASEIGDGVWWTPALNETSITEVLQNLNDWDVPNLYLDVFRSGHTLYPSNVFPQRAEAGDRDWLQYIIAEAHQRNIRVHAWIQVLCWRDEDSEVLTTHPLLIKNPDWIDQSRDTELADVKTSAIYVSPAEPAVLDSLVALSAELGKYPFDGLNLDAVQYNPLLEGGYSSPATSNFRATESADPAGLRRDLDSDSLWMKWVAYREDQLTSVVQVMGSTARDAATSAGRRLLVSANVNPGYEQTRGVNLRYQHWDQWLEEKLIDASIPQCFSSELPALEQQLWQVRSVHMGSGIACIPGLSLGGRESAAHPTLKEQKRLLRNAGFQYCTVLDYEALKQEMEAPPEKEENDRGGLWGFFSHRSKRHEQ